MFLKNSWLLILIILLGLFLRAYNLERLAVFDYDQETAAVWIKNLIIDHKFSLVGQETSVGGVYIAPFFYFLLAPFYFLSGLNPLAGNIFVILVSLLTMVFLYKWSRSHIALFLYAIHPGIINFDRIVAPSNMAILLSTATAYFLTKIRKTKLDYLFLGTILGLTFSIHPPTILLIPICLLWFALKKEKVNLLFFLPIIILVSPLIIFETRHGFVMAQNIFKFSQTDLYYPLLFRVILNLKLFLIYWSGILISSDLFFIKYPLMGLAVWLWIKNKDLVFRLWTLLPFLFLVFYPRPAPEYYLQMITPIVLVYSIKYLPKIFVLLIIVAGVIFSLLSLPKNDNLLSFYYKNQAVASLPKNTPVTIYYSADLGQNWGFNYLLWWQKVDVQNNSPKKYLFVIPASREPQTSGIIFGAVKVANISR
ncbi:MAG: glycosyltransferase family 39 protein [Patescibacteria group bacterium]